MFRDLTCCVHILTCVLVVFCVKFSTISAADILVSPSFANTTCNRIDLQCPNLRLAVDITESNDVIFMNPGLYSGDVNEGICKPQYVNKQVRLPCIFRNVTLAGLGSPEEIVVQGNLTYQTRALYVEGSSFTQIRNLTFDGFSYNASGGGGAALAIELTINLTLVNVIFRNNRGETGGAVRILNSGVQIINTKFLSNYVYGLGGGLYTEHSNLSISKSYFENNKAGSEYEDIFGAGGAIYAYPYQLHIEDTIFHSNSATISGGAVAISFPYALRPSYSAFSINDAVFQNNSVDGYGACSSAETCTPTGGALYFTEGVGKIRRTKFTGNKATSTNELKFAFGGAIYSGSSDITERTQSLEFENCSFVGNVAYGSGGAVVISNFPTTFNEVVFTKNIVKLDNFPLSTQSTSGGAVQIEGSSARVTFTKSSFHLNIATGGSGGSIFVSQRADLNISLS
jgi:hypothetical protein